MDIQPTNQQPISDDQELAKVLAGVNQQADASGLQFEETSTGAPAAEPAVADPVDDTADPVAAAPVVPAAAPAADSELEGVKIDALNELRPLVEKLNISAEEKFDTYLLIIRSTDDKSLIAPAHAAAQAITDEARRAQALLDIIKEIDYLSHPQA